MQVKVPIEVDVTYVNHHWHSGRPQSKDKHYVIGFYQRGIKGHANSIAIIQAIPDNKPETIEKFLLLNVEKGCLLYCHKNILPPSLNSSYQIHELKEGSHADGDIHINNVNNMWKSLKRQIKREHVSVSKKHLQLYCDEVTWRINTSHLTPLQRFEDLITLSATFRPKDTYRDLVK